MADNAVTRQSCRVMGSAIDYLKRAGGDASSPTLILLHGFPECAEAWLPVLAALPDNLNVIIPDLPGFGCSAALPSETDYQVTKLVSRLARFTELVTTSATHLVGHDWGGALAWPLAAFFPDKFDTLTIINAAHPSAFVRELKYNSLQREKSIYINTLNKPGVAEDLARRDFRLLKRIMGDSLFLSGNSYAQRIISNWEDTARLDAMLAYYRNMPQGVPVNDEEAEAMVVPDLKLPIPVYVLWGCQDEAFDQAVLAGLDEWVDDLSIVRREDATHWLHREQPEWVANQLTVHIATHT